MNGIVAFFCVVGILTVGAILAFLVTPFLTYLLEIIAYGMAYIVGKLVLRKSLKKYPKLTNKPVYDCDDGNNQINLPNQVNQLRDFVVDKQEIGNITNIHELSETSYSKTPQSSSNMSIQPIATKLNKVFNIFHVVWSFYQGYYMNANRKRNKQ